MRTHPWRLGIAAALLGGLALGGRALAHFGASPDDFAAAESAAFTEADADHDGKLTLSEFTVFHDLLRQKLEALRFAALDTDGDGALTQAELAAGRPGGHGGRGFRRGF